MLGIRCPDRHALPRFTSSKTFHGDVRSSRASGFVLRREAVIEQTQTLIGAPPNSTPSTSPLVRVGFGEGFRMPARRDLSARAEGRRPKASQEGTRGGRRQLAVYGDLTMRRLALWMRWPAQSAADRRLRWRVWRDRCSLQGNFSLIDGIGRAVGAGGATAMQRRKRGSPAGGRCNEAVMGVMASWP